MKIYVASSWKNPHQPGVVEALRSAGHDVYDFRNPRPGDAGFHWAEIDPQYASWTLPDYCDALKHPLAETGFKQDFEAMRQAEIFVGVAPFGRSASMEMGYAVGAGKLSILYMAEPLGDWELMVKMFDHICLTLDEVLDILEARKNSTCSTCAHYCPANNDDDDPNWHSPEWCFRFDKEISGDHSRCQNFK